MSLDIYFPEDLERVCDALELTIEYQSPSEFRAGFLAALDVVRAAFGLSLLQKTVIMANRETAKLIQKGGDTDDR
jgi:hypothetical protein